MSVLAIDSCRRADLVALTATRDGELIELFTATGSLANSLPAMLASLLSEEVNDVVVLNGPGSYTGVRAGMAAAFGLVASRAFALRAVDRLTALAACGGQGKISCVLDAGRAGAYVQTFARRENGVPQAASPAAHVSLSDWAPPGDTECLADFALESHRVAHPTEIVLAGTRVAMLSAPVAPDSVRPVYVSRPNWQRQSAGDR